MTISTPLTSRPGLVTTNDPPSIRKSKSLTTKTYPPIDSAAHRRIAPEDVLFSRKRAPTRYAEHDIYWANERELPDGGRAAIKPVLPDSDLLKSIHGYACQFYETMDWRVTAKRKVNEATGETPAASEDGVMTGRMLDERSMDETALLAFGILLEEAGRGTLGKTGDLAFVDTEGQEEDDVRELVGDGIVIGQVPVGKPESGGPVPSTSRRHEDGEEMQVELERERTPKRRRKA